VPAVVNSKEWKSLRGDGGGMGTRDNVGHAVSGHEELVGVVVIGAVVVVAEKPVKFPVRFNRGVDALLLCRLVASGLSVMHFAILEFTLSPVKTGMCLFFGVFLLGVRCRVWCKEVGLLQIPVRLFK
jgi:hypothetical protein